MVARRRRLISHRFAGEGTLKRVVSKACPNVASYLRASPRQRPDSRMSTRKAMWPGVWPGVATAWIPVASCASPSIIPQRKPLSSKSSRRSPSSSPPFPSA
jgi:hypothetical protein